MPAAAAPAPAAAFWLTKSVISAGIEREATLELGLDTFRFKCISVWAREQAQSRQTDKQTDRGTRQAAAAGVAGEGAGQVGISLAVTGNGNGNETPATI